MDRDLIAKIIDKVFPPGSSPAWNADDVPPQERFWVIPGKSGPRWIIPRNPLVGWPALKQWRPYDLSSRLKWAAITTAYRARQLGLMPGVAPIGVAGSSDLSWEHVGWREDPTPVPVIYVGTPGPTRKAVATLVKSTDRSFESVAKVPLTPAAASSILREAEILDRLAVDKPGSAPSLLFVDRERGVSAQKVICGRPTGRKLTKSHLDWLGDLLIPGMQTSLHEQAGGLANRLAALPNVDNETRSFLNVLLEQMKDITPLPMTWVHGDFAPWNLKWIGHGRLAAVDWENADAEGIPFYDLFYFRHVQNYCFQEAKSVDDVRPASYAHSTISAKLLENIGRLTAIKIAIQNLESSGNRGFVDYVIRKLR